MKEPEAKRKIKAKMFESLKELSEFVRNSFNVSSVKEVRTGLMKRLEELTAEKVLIEKIA